ncbi:MAG: hypothetical protein AAGM67_18550, partial [Bacteroidota bacterium]
MIKRYLTIFGLAVLSTLPLQGSPTSYQTLNATVDHINAHLRYYWMVHRELVELNRNLNSYFSGQKTELPAWEASSLRMPPLEALDQVPPAFISEVRELTRIQQSQRSLMQSLQQYHQEASYQDDEAGVKVFALFAEVEENFAALQKVHREFELVISPENFRQGLMEDHDHFLDAAQELHQHVQTSRKLIQAVQEGRESELQ